MKKVTVYSTVGKKATILENLEATTWGELKSALREMDIKYSGMKAVIGETRNTLESDRATLPEKDFSLFLMPVKTKSGADRKQLMADYKANPDAQAHFKSKGLQITRMKTPDIEAELAKVTGKPVNKDVEERGKKAAEKAVERMSGKAPKAEKKPEKAEKDVDYDKLIEEKKSEIDAAMKAGNYGAIADLGKELEGIETAKKLAEEEKKKAAKKAAEQIADKLDKEARDIAKDFSDVRI